MRRVNACSIAELTGGLADCERRQTELVQSLELLRGVETAEAVAELTSERDEVALELTALKAALASTRALLEKGVAQWRELETRSESVATWLKEAEARMRTETARQADLAHLDEHIQEMAAFLKQVGGARARVARQPFFGVPWGDTLLRTAVPDRGL